MSIFQTYQLLLLFVLPIVGAKRILFFNMFNSKSHAWTMLPLAEALSDHGHNVSMYTMTHASFGRQLGTRINPIESIVPFPSSDPDDGLFNQIVWFNKPDPYSFFFPYLITMEYFENALKTPEFWRIANETWDLIVCDEMFGQPAFAFALKQQRMHGTSFIIFSTSEFFPNIMTTFRALNRNPVIAPNFHLDVLNLHWDVNAFYSRLKGVHDLIAEYIGIVIGTERVSRSTIASQFDYADFSFSDAFVRSSLTFTDFPERYSWPMPVARSVISIGGYCVPPDGQLSPALAEFVNDAQSNGTIYVAFGSLVNWYFAPTHFVRAIVDALNELVQYRIIWSYKGPQLGDLHKHIKILDWAPQSAILQHSKTILFVSHGGLKSVREAICSETPVVNLAFFADQLRNSLIARELGYAEYLSKLDIDRQKIVDVILKVTQNNDRYVSAVRRVRRLFIDRIIDPMTEGVFWTEKVMMQQRQNTTTSMTINGAYLTWIAYLYIDWIIAASLILAIL